MRKQLTYEAQVADLEADGKHVRLVSRLEGPYHRYRSPRHVERLTEEQARGLRDSLNEALENL